MEEPNILDVKAVHENPRFKTELITYENSDGETRRTYCIATPGDLLVIIPRLDNKIVLQKTMMPPRLLETWSFPTGYVIPGIAIADTAQQILLEQTGTAAQRFIYAGAFAPSRFISNVAHVFIGERLQKIKGKYEEYRQKLKVFSEKDIGTLLMKREIDDGLALASYVYYCSSEHYWSEVHRGASNPDNTGKAG